MTKSAKVKAIYETLIKSGNTLVDLRDLDVVISKMLIEGAEFKIENTTAIGIRSVTMTKLPVKFSYNPV